MPQSFAQALLHFVYSTKHREPLLKDPEIRDQMNAYVATTLKTLKCNPIKVNCVSDHIHFLCGIDRSVSLANIIKEVKTSSSKWIKTKGADYRNFYWQLGYGAFSVSFSNAEQVVSYITTQEEHHRRRTFQDEYRQLLRAHNLEWDEKYVWD